MIPTRQQFRKWSYPSKFGFVSFFIATSITFALWLFPDSGKNWMSGMLTEADQVVPVPGQNALERQINLAKMQGVARSIPSTEFAIAVPFARPSMPRSSSSDKWHDGLVALSNSSPLRSANQDLVFAPGRCRFLGSLQWQDQATMKGNADVSIISCVLDNGEAYGFGTADGPPIGYLALLEEPMNRSLPLVREERSVTLPLPAQYIVRLFSPLSDIPRNGRSMSPW